MNWNFNPAGAATSATVYNPDGSSTAYNWVPMAGGPTSSLVMFSPSGVATYYDVWYPTDTFVQMLDPVNYKVEQSIDFIKSGGSTETFNDTHGQYSYTSAEIFYNAANQQTGYDVNGLGGVNYQDQFDTSNGKVDQSIMSPVAGGNITIDQWNTSGQYPFNALQSIFNASGQAIQNTAWYNGSTIQNNYQQINGTTQLVEGTDWTTSTGFFTETEPDVYGQSWVTNTYSYNMAGQLLQATQSENNGGHYLWQYQVGTLTGIDYWNPQGQETVIYGPGSSGPPPSSTTPTQITPAAAPATVSQAAQPTHSVPAAHTTTPPPGAISGIGSSQYSGNEVGDNSTVSSYDVTPVEYFSAGGDGGYDGVGPSSTGATASMSFLGGSSGVSAASGLATPDLGSAAASVKVASQTDLLPAQSLGVVHPDLNALLRSILAFDASQPSPAVPFALATITHQPVPAVALPGH